MCNGLALQALKDKVRRQRAIGWLQCTTKPIKQVAEAAGFQKQKSFIRAFKIGCSARRNPSNRWPKRPGFQNEKSFIRAFKGWTGLTPGDFRSQTPPLA